MNLYLEYIIKYPGRNKFEGQPNFFPKPNCFHNICIPLVQVIQKKKNNNNHNYTTHLIIRYFCTYFSSRRVRYNIKAYTIYLYLKMLIS